MNLAVTRGPRGWNPAAARPFEKETWLCVQGDMATDGTESTPLMLPRIGAAIGGAALICPALTLPLVVTCLFVLGNAALSEARAADNVVPEVPPVSGPRGRGRRANADISSEDSFPASDPPAWTPITGTGTRH